MTKRKRSTPKEPTPGVPGAGGESEPSVHVSSDMLAGSPDVFAPSKEEPAESSDASAMSADAKPEEEPAPASETSSAFDESSSMSAEAPAPPAEAPAEPPATEAVTTTTPPPPAYQPRPPAMVAPGPAQRRAGSTVALGVVLVVLGLFALLVQFTGFDPGGSWPLFIVIPGLTLLIVGFVSLGTGALIPGAILTVIGLILAYMNATQDWPAWAFAWPLVAPGGVGLGIWLQGLRNHDAQLLRQGRVLMFVALLIFMIGFVIFGTIFRISETDYGLFGKAALPGLLIVIGIVLLARSIQRSRTS
ncbi:MAG: hypothetical protein E6I23_10530 [Chloroflexi bacterium]|nr:MAG: hypothetical protein AUH32_00185 [Actinobacteria bacterium 13_1_40CM_66_12]TMF43415.1 MAG: hypothetical protein E6I23_10530 [Chloroflexota bacterium]